mmetsp:Transcript_12569/g.28408  ORF Transcript_12569/g.28408 Transcript_12569/m.28408 type:complete len:1016 (-) Transcript_12569:152-3199(-)
MAEAWGRLKQARLALSEAGSFDASGVDGRVLPWTPLRGLAWLPTRCRDSIVRILDFADPSGFLSQHLVLLAVVLSIWMVAGMSMASRHEFVRQQVASFWRWWQGPSAVPSVGLALLCLAVLLEQDAMVVYLRVDNYCSAAAQTLAACVAATIGCAEPKLKVLRVQQAVSVQCMTFGCLLAVVCTRIWLDLQHKELDLHTSLPEARGLALVFATLGVVAALHGVGRLLGLPLLSGFATRFGKLVVMLVRFGCVLPCSCLRQVVVRHVAPAMFATIQEVVRLLRPVVQLTKRIILTAANFVWCASQTCWRRLRRVIVCARASAQAAAAMAYSHLVLPLCAQASRLRSAFWRFAASVVRWLVQNVLSPLWLATTWAARQLHRLWVALSDAVDDIAARVSEAVNRLMSALMHILWRAAEAGTFAIATCTRWILRWAVVPVCKAVLWLHDEVILPLCRLSYALVRTMATGIAGLLKRLWLHVSAQCSLCWQAFCAGLQEAMRRVILPTCRFACRAMWRLILHVLWPALVAVGRATVPVRRLVSPSGCFVTAASFAYHLCRRWELSEPLGVWTTVAFLLASHCSASIGILLLGRAMRRTFAGQDLSVVGAKLESAGAWLFLHLDLAICSRLWMLGAWLYRYSSLTLLQIVGALAAVMRSIAIAAEGLLDSVLHTMAASSMYVWKAWIRPTIVFTCRSIWGAISLVWRNPLVSVAASGALMAYMYQVHLGRTSLPDGSLLWQALKVIGSVMTLPFKWMPTTLVAWAFGCMRRLLGCFLAVGSFLWNGAVPAMAITSGHAFGLLTQLSSRPFEMYSVPVFAKVAAVVGLSCSRISLLVGRNMSWQEQVELAARIGRTSQRMLFIPVLSLAMISQVGSWIMLGFAGLAAAPLTLVYITCSVGFLAGEVAVWRRSSARLAAHREQPRYTLAGAAGSAQPKPCSFTPASEAKLLFCEDGEECTVCMEPMQIPPSDVVLVGAREVVALRCGHAFHEECIRTWCSKSSRCPLCREVVAGRGNILQALF